MDSQLLTDLLDFIAAPAADEASFNAMALRLFAHQYAYNLPLQRVCQQRGRTPRTVRDWREIPPVPINAFKDLTLSAQDIGACQRVFMTSGTTRGDVRGRHYHPHLQVYDLSMRLNFQRHILRGHQRMRVMVLFPGEDQMPHSSLAHYLALAREHFGTPDSRHYIDAQGLRLDDWCADLHQACQQAQPVLVLGASYSLVHACDALAAQGLNFQLPAGSQIMDTGGFKGQSRELNPDEFYATLQRSLGVAPERCHNMYGMTELSTQFYDAGQHHRPVVKRGAHWIRTRVLDPLSGQELPAGQVGVLAHTDLGNFNSVLTILTEDLGHVHEDGFVLLGRAQGAQAKGCSLAVESFLQAAHA
ncbi:MAG: long-chain fatty acid--CoA ligase [Alphaproteobacteria bacterium]|nr:long-chain fatty acid--CoA ligase [Alphaproteobacteria bacterium]